MAAPAAIRRSGLRMAPLEQSPLIIALVLAVSSVSAALVALMILSLWSPRRGASAPLPIAEERAVFLFDDRELIDASGAGRRLLAAAPARGDAWTQLASALTPIFPEFEARMATLAKRGFLTMQANGDRSLGLLAEWRGGLARITLTDDDAGGRQTQPVDWLSHRAMVEEIENLRATMDQAPVLMWRQDETGAVVQANRAYLALAEAQAGEELSSWPLPALFDRPATETTDGRSWRARLDPTDGAKPRWFDCHSCVIGVERLHFAQPADALVQAEASLRDFVQTLSKTFAHLQIGLAVFDRARRLQLFNPALSDLTTLSPDFLIGRPTLATFLDRLRERHMLPEPKDYRSWRQRITDLEEAAAQGHYQETWELPGGQTYRVSGRPHPEGAVAFLFEDISAEVTMNRRFRAEMALGQSVLDALDEAVVVFSDRGTVTLTNAAYDGLWQTGAGATGRGAGGAGEALQVWREGCRPGGDWDRAASRLRDALLPMHGAAGAPRRGWTAQLVLLDGRCLSLRLAPLPGGSTLVAFRVADANARSGADRPKAEQDGVLPKPAASAADPAPGGVGVAPLTIAPSPRRIN